MKRLPDGVRDTLAPWFTPLVVTGIALTLWSDYQRWLLFRDLGVVPGVYTLVLSHVLIVFAGIVWVVTRRQRR